MTDTAPDPGCRYRLSQRVGLRPEPFGALAYHFDTRRLVFLKSPDLVAFVRGLADHPTLDDALHDGVDPRRHRSFRAALSSLIEAGVVERVSEPLVAASVDPIAPPVPAPPPTTVPESTS